MGGRRTRQIALAGAYASELASSARLEVVVCSGSELLVLVRGTNRRPLGSGEGELIREVSWYSLSLYPHPRCDGMKGGRLRGIPLFTLFLFLFNS